jgi:tRNA threonylcarbamoyladenosine biosynthesis protein TsaE
MVIALKNEEEMLAVSSRLAKACEPPLVIYLVGQLGAGKTTFSRGFLAGLGYKGKVKSPTYTLVEVYDFPYCDVFHFDLYRIHSPEELESIGIRDYFHARSLCLIEWPEYGKDSIPPADITCYFELTANGRKIEFFAHTQRGDRIIKLVIGQ